MTRKLFVLVSMLSLALPAAAKDSKPDWVRGASGEYPREQYMIGVGQADDMNSARERARAEIAKIFKVEVKAKSGIAESESTSGRGGKVTETSFSQAVHDDVQTATDQALRGVEVPENWQDPATKVHYALAVLDRSKGLGILKDKIEEFDKKAEEWRSQMDSAGDKRTKIKAAIKLMAILRARDQLSDPCRVLDPGSKAPPSPYDLAKVRTEASKAIAGLEVYVDFQCSMKDEAGRSADDACGSEVETGIVKGVTSLGFEAQTAATSAEVDVVVQGKVTIGPMKGDKSEWRWARSTVTVSMKDGRTSKTFQRFDTTDRQASTDYEEAARRSRVSVGKKVAQAIKDATMEYFENQ